MKPVTKPIDINSLDEEKNFELALSLVETDRVQARELCFKLLNREPNHKLGRLLLARLFYLDELFEFSLRELVCLSALVNTPSLGKLIAEFGPLAEKYFSQAPLPQTGMSMLEISEATDSAEESEVLAELDLDADFSELELELNSLAKRS